MKPYQAEERSDAELLQLARDERNSRVGKEAASELFGRYREPVYQWCLRRVRDHEMALDLAQDALLSAYRKLDSFDERSLFSSWLFAITRNRCLNALRRPSLLGEEDFEVEALADPRKRQDRELEEREEENRILSLIREHLDPFDQEVLWLRCFEKMPVDAITASLKIDDASGARGALQRARRRLRAALDAREHEEGGDRK